MEDRLEGQDSELAMVSETPEPVSWVKMVLPLVRLDPVVRRALTNCSLGLSICSRTYPSD